MTISKMRKREAMLGYLFASPWIVGFLVLFAYPLGSSIFYSFTNYNGGTMLDFIGLNNFVAVFANSSFTIGLLNTFWWVFFNTIATTILGVLMAYLVKPKVKGIKLFRTLYYIPNVLSGIAVAFIWQWVFNDLGPINAMLEAIGIEGIGWLTKEAVVKPTLLMMSLWGVGSVLMIYLAALQGVPIELYEAARVDGAGIFTIFMRITLPAISPTLFFNIIMGMIGGFQNFLNAFMVTGGGPNNASFFVGQLIYTEAFTQNHFGFASAISWVLMVIMLSLTMLIQKLSNKLVFYMDGGNV